MTNQESPNFFLFPKWTNLLAPGLAALGLGAGLYFGVLVPYALNPGTLNVGYQPRQPVPYSHALHVGKLGLDCRYCHTTVEDSALAALPPTQTCWNCHGKTISAQGAESGPGVLWDSDNLRAVKDHYTAGTPIAWVKVHDLADYAYFNHGAHLSAGIGCVSCHGRVDKMEVVYQAEDLSMGWCIDCHRNPEANIRPTARLFDLGWDQAGATETEKEEISRLARSLKNPRQLTDCSTCHR